jgi:hypothetical protein
MYVYDPASSGIEYHAYCYSPTGYMKAALWLMKNTDPKQSVYVPSDAQMESTLYVHMELPFLYDIYRVAYRQTEVYGEGFHVVISDLSSKNTSKIYFIMGRDFSLTPVDLLFIESNMTKAYENDDCYIFLKA